MAIQSAGPDDRGQHPFWGFEPINTGVIPKENYPWVKKNIGSLFGDDDIIRRRVGDSQLAVLKDTSPITLVMGGNQSGKSTVSILDALISLTGFIPYALEGIYPPRKIIDRQETWARLLCTSDDVLRNTIVPTFKRLVPKEMLIDGEWKKSWQGGSQLLELKGTGEKKAFVEMFTHRQPLDTHQGPRRDLLIFDELPPKNVYLESIVRLTTAQRPRILLAATPTKGISSWLYRDLVGRVEDDEGVSLFKLASLANPLANLEVLKEVAHVAGTPEIMRMRLFGDFVSTDEPVYADVFRRSDHVVEAFPIDQSYLVVRGLDPHLTKPTVALEVAIDREGVVYVCGFYQRKALISQIKEDLYRRAIERSYRLYTTVVDAATNVNISLYSANPYNELSQEPMRIPMMRPSSKVHGAASIAVGRIRSYLISGKLKIFNLPELKPLVYCLESLEAKNVRDGSGENKGDINHDSHACLRYIFGEPLRHVPPEEHYLAPSPDREGDRYI